MWMKTNGEAERDQNSSTDNGLISPRDLFTLSKQMKEGKSICETECATPEPMMASLESRLLVLKSIMASKGLVRECLEMIRGDSVLRQTESHTGH